MARRILITGGTGFLGQRLAKTLSADWDVTICARNHKQAFAAEKATGARYLPMDVTSIESVRDALREIRPEAVIHAAATKFVDLSERQPLECVDVNIVGSQNVARAAMDFGVRTVVGISTDKAAPPVRNLYGISKAAMEKMFCLLDGKTDTRFVCVRYGNVAWSTGSVFPIWQKMHAETGVLRSTGPDMTRFFFTIEEAVDLVLLALRGVEDFRGQVLSREMKAAMVRDILDVWTEEKGGRWEQGDPRPGDRPYECLIGDLELPYTRKLDCDGVAHFLISFRDKVSQPLSGLVSSDNCPRLSRPELARLISHIPAEAL